MSVLASAPRPWQGGGGVTRPWQPAYTTSSNLFRQSRQQYTSGAVAHQHSVSPARASLPQFTCGSRVHRVDARQDESRPPPPPLVAPPKLDTTSTVKVHLEHGQHIKAPNVPGYNRAADPWQHSVGGGYYSGGASQQRVIESSTLPRNADASQRVGYNVQKHNEHEFKRTGQHSVHKRITADEYLQRTGGLFGTDPSLSYPKAAPQSTEAHLNTTTLNAVLEEDRRRGPRRSPNMHNYKAAEADFGYTADRTTRQMEQAASFKHMPSTLRIADEPHPDETLQSLRRKGRTLVGEIVQKLEAESTKGAVERMDPPKAPMAPPPVEEEPPRCSGCGKNIVGVYCSGGGRDYHADCFKCATCAAPLAHVGYHLLHGKLYCDVHATQRQRLDDFGAKSPHPPAAFLPSSARPQPLPGSQEPVNAFYQPDVLKPGPLGPVQKPLPRQPPSQTGHPPPMTDGERPSAGGAESCVSGTTMRGRGVLKQVHEIPRTPVCADCHKDIKGPFILALSKTWCPEHFVCAGAGCGRRLADVGFVEEQGNKYCEPCFEQHFAPKCAQCRKPITGDCLNALQKQWHPDCFTCAHCHRPFGNQSFYLEDGKPYCETDWNALFTTKCVACHRPIEAGARWVEALGAAYHCDCFQCTQCRKRLEGESFYAKAGKPYCKAHA